MGVWGCHGGQAEVGWADGGHHGLVLSMGLPML